MPLDVHADDIGPKGAAKGKGMGKGMGQWKGKG